MSQHRTFWIMAGIPVMLTLCLCAELSAVTVDGKFDPLEGYTQGYSLSITGETKGNKKNPSQEITVGGGEIWVSDVTGQNVYLFVSIPVGLVDNTYGENSIGWGKNVAPSGKNHNFNDMVESDDSRFQFTNANGDIVLDVTLDYFAQLIDGTYGIPPLNSTESEVHLGSASDIIDYATSMAYNYNLYAGSTELDITEDSPATDENYAANSDFPDWIYEVTFEIEIDRDVFGSSGVGDAFYVEAHYSPNKIGKNVSSDITIGDVPLPPPGPPISGVPEPMTLFTGVMGVLAIGAYTRQRMASHG